MCSNSGGSPEIRCKGREVSLLKAVRRGIANEPRDVAMYLIRSMRAEPLIRVGAGFGLNRYSSVSSAVILQAIRFAATATKLMFCSVARITNKFCYLGAKWRSETPLYLVEEVGRDANRIE
jgi:hypothetical protein